MSFANTVFILGSSYRLPCNQEVSTVACYVKVMMNNMLPPNWNPVRAQQLSINHLVIVS